MLGELSLLKWSAVWLRRYGEPLIDRIARDLTDRVGRVFPRTSVFQIVPYKQTLQTASGQSTAAEKLQTLSAQLPTFPLSWSHYVRLLSVQDLNARRLYEDQALRAGWSVRQLAHRVHASMVFIRIIGTHGLSAYL